MNNKAIIISLFSAIFTGYAALANLWGPQSFEIEKIELIELKGLRSEIVELVGNEAQCYPALDLQTFSDKRCEAPLDSKTENHPIELANKIRVRLFKAAHLFTTSNRDKLKISGQWRPFSRPPQNALLKLTYNDFLNFFENVDKALLNEIQS